jgi:serine protease Do
MNNYNDHGDRDDLSVGGREDNGSVEQLSPGGYPPRERPQNGWQQDGAAYPPGGYTGGGQQGDAQSAHGAMPPHEPRSTDWNREYPSAGMTESPPPQAYSRPVYQRSPRGGSYQYTPNNGWQQTGGQDPRSPASDTRSQWEFHDYDKWDKRRSPEGRRQNRGLIVFTFSLVGLLVVSLVALTGYSILFGGNEPAPGGGEGGGASSASSAVSGASSQAGDPKLELSNKPQSAVSPPARDGGLLTIPQIAKQVSPSVVGVSAYLEARFYEPVSVGSGIVMSADGYIITNAHVVAGGTNFKVQLLDNTPYDAVLIGSDDSTDLAVLKIEAEGLTPAVFGNSEELEVGETVVAIGNPSGVELAGSVTRGIVSAVDRQVTTQRYDFKYIQTDAAINPGNSGGALVNEYGQVIGINSSKIVAAGYEGIGFAIPISDAKPILDDIIANGRVTGRVMLGVGCDIVSEADALKYGIPMGLEILEIYENSDLRNQDVQLGDILIEVDGERVYTLPDVQRILTGKSVGDEVALKLYRRISTVQSSEIEVTAKLVEN